MAFHAAMPELLWREILFDFGVGAVIDLTPADGLLAMAARHARIPYTGLVFTRRHTDELLHRLQSLVIAGATREGDTWYDPHLVESLNTSKPKAKEKSPNKRHCGDRCRDEAQNEEKKGEACNKVPTHGKGIQDG